MQCVEGREGESMGTVYFVEKDVVSTAKLIKGKESDKKKKKEHAGEREEGERRRRGTKKTTKKNKT